MFFIQILGKILESSEDFPWTLQMTDWVIAFSHEVVGFKTLEDLSALYNTVPLSCL
jgi:hypothetical protein